MLSTPATGPGSKVDTMTPSALDSQWDERLRPECWGKGGFLGGVKGSEFGGIKEDRRTFDSLNSIRAFDVHTVFGSTATAASLWGALCVWGQYVGGMVCRGGHR